GHVVADADREVRAVASRAVAARPGVAASVRAIGSRADATTIAPLAAAAWPEVAAEMVIEPSTRAWALAVSLAGRTAPELVAMARASGSDPGRIAAVLALGRIGGDEAKACLEAIVADKSEHDAVRAAAYKALKRLLRAAAKRMPEGDKGPKHGGGLGGRGGGGDGAEEADADEGDDEG